MSDTQIQMQIAEINRKLDLVLEEVAIQRQNREAVTDLVDDVAVIGKDAFRHMVKELDNAGIQIDGEELKRLLLAITRNIGNISNMLETIESVNDLIRDLTPIVRQIGLDGIRKLNELEQKGYFEILNQLVLTFDTLASRYTREELRTISTNLIPVADTLIGIGDQRVLEKINAISKALRDIDADNIEEYSVWRLAGELRKPEFKRTLGFVMAFIKNINSNNNQ
ncbi:MAG: DUF1641 domain-containing protein [Bacteroidales bacterium]